MKKTRLSIALMTALLSVGTLAGCDNDYATYSPAGELVTYQVGNGPKQTIVADEIFKEYYNDSDKYQSIFDAIKSIIVKNYFSVEKVTVNGKSGIETGVEPDGSTIVLGKAQVKDLEIETSRDVSSKKDQARLNAKNNNTDYDDEFEKILTSNGVETEDELFEKFLDEKKVAKFDDNYYKYHLDEIKNGNTEIKTTDNKQFWTGYFEDMLPYHVSHILVKVEDGANNNYYNGTVSEDNCEKLYLLMNDLVDSDKTFGMIANTYSEDDGSAEKYGALGIMDYSTPYVDEFKLGVYAYENFFGDYADEAKSSLINIPGDSTLTGTARGIEGNFVDEVSTLYDMKDGFFPEVDVNVFADLYKSRKLTRSTSIDEETGKINYDNPVMEGNSLVFPRNLIYNEELNKHSFAFITTQDASKVTLDSSSEEGDTGFYNYTSGKLSGKKILSVISAGVARPILMVRAGSDYQGIHFIIINRDAFLEGEDANGVNRENYYTTYNTKQTGYPKDSDGKQMQTYVNFNLEFGGQDAETRANNLISTLKSYDSDKLSKFIFKKYMKAEDLKICDPNLEYALNKWIDRNIDSKVRSSNEAWDSKWTEYVGVLRTENEERTKLMSPVARLGFDRNVLASLTAKMDGTKVVDFIIDENAEDTLSAYCESIGMEAEDITEAIASIAAYNNTHKTSKIETIADLYNKKGALCNDGKEYK